MEHSKGSEDKAKAGLTWQEIFHSGYVEQREIIKKNHYGEQNANLRNKARKQQRNEGTKLNCKNEGVGRKSRRFSRHFRHRTGILSGEIPKPRREETRGKH